MLYSARENLVPMERNRRANAKGLRASGRKPVNNNLPETHTSRVQSGQPKDRNFAPRREVVRRFNQSAAVTNQGFPLSAGHDQFLTVTNSGTGAAVPYVDSWRIKKIDLFAWGSTDGFPTTVTLTPVGTDVSSNMINDPEQIFSMTARSATVAKHMRIITSPSRPLGGWHFTSNVNPAGTLFQINIGSGAGTQRNVIMDITFEIVENLAGSPLGYGVITATTTLGTIGGRNPITGFTLVGVNNLG
jgi:hypothetical protein